MKIRTTALVSALCAATLPTLPIVASGSSHREAPNIARLPTVDSTDFYMFNSYEAGRSGYVVVEVPVRMRPRAGGVPSAGTRASVGFTLRALVVLLIGSSRRYTPRGDVRPDEAAEP